MLATVRQEILDGHGHIGLHVRTAYMLRGLEGLEKVQGKNSQHTSSRVRRHGVDLVRPVRCASDEDVLVDMLFLRKTRESEGGW